MDSFNSLVPPFIKIGLKSTDIFLQKKAIWHLAIWQNWSFGQFYHSRIEVLQNCSPFLCQFLWRGKFEGRKEFIFQKIRAFSNIVTALIVSMVVFHINTVVVHDLFLFLAGKTFLISLWLEMNATAKKS